MQYNNQPEIDRRIKHIKRDDLLSEAERELLLDFYEEIKTHNRRSSAKNQLSGTRINTHLAHCHRVAKHTDLLVDTMDPDQGSDPIDEIGEWIDDTYDNGYTIDNYVSGLRALGRFCAPDARTEEDKHPKRFEILELGNVEEDQPAPDPSDVLFWSEVVTLLAACASRPTGDRTAALIAMLWASGMRPMSELWELQFGQIDDRGDHMIISVQSDSKTLSRTIRIDVGLPYIRRWMNKKHPAHDTEEGPQSDTYLWTPLDDTRLIGYAQLRKSIKRVNQLTDITKPVNPEHFRKSRASVLAMSRWVTQRDLENHFGWVRGSRVVAHYIAVFEQQSQKHIAKADGADVDLSAEMDPIVPVWCDHCDQQTPRHRDECLWCEQETVAELNRTPRMRSSSMPDDEDEKDLLDLIMSGDVEARDLEALQTLEPVIRRRDDLFDRLDSYISHAEKLES